MINVEPVLKLVPPVGVAYQFIIPALAVTPKDSVPISHRVLGAVLVIVATVPTL